MTLTFDFETSRHCGNMPWIPTAYPVLMCLVDSSNDVGQTFVFNHKGYPHPYDKTDCEALQRMIDKADLLVAHNAKFDLHWLTAIGIKWQHKAVWCTMVGEYVLWGQDKGIDISLEETALRYGVPPKQDIVKLWWDSGYETDEIPFEIVKNYCLQDVYTTKAIYEKQFLKLKKQKQLKLMRLENETLKVLQDMEWNGMVINVEQAIKFSDELADEMSTLEKDMRQLLTAELPELKEIVDEPSFKFSNEQLSAVLFGGVVSIDGQVAGAREGTTKKGKIKIETKGLGFKPARNTETAKKGYYQVDAAQLDQLTHRRKNPKQFIENMRQLSKAEKMKSTYFDGLVDKQFSGTIHHSLNQTVTKTGRLSCTKPNLQNTPREGTSPVKSIFVSRYL